MAKRPLEGDDPSHNKRDCSVGTVPWNIQIAGAGWQRGDVVYVTPVIAARLRRFCADRTVPVTAQDGTPHNVPTELLTRVVVRPLQNGPDMLQEHPWFQQWRTGDVWFCEGKQTGGYKNFAIARFGPDHDGVPTAADDAEWRARLQHLFKAWVYGRERTQRCLFTRIPCSVPRKFYYDIDIAATEELKDRLTVAHTERLARIWHTRVVEPALRDELAARTAVPEFENDFIVEQATIEFEKGSIHGTYSVLFATADAQKTFVVQRLLPQWEAAIAEETTDAEFLLEMMGRPSPDNKRFDLGVYNKNRNWRLHGNTKPGKNAWLRPTSVVGPDLREEMDYMIASLVHAPPSVEHAFANSPTARAHLAAEPEPRQSKPRTLRTNGTSHASSVSFVNSLLDLLDQTARGIGGGSCFAATAGTDDKLIKLTRTRPAYCKLCGRTHENDNAFLVLGADIIKVGCHRNKGAYTIDLEAVLAHEEDDDRRNALRREVLACGSDEAAAAQQVETDEFREPLTEELVVGSEPAFPEVDTEVERTICDGVTVGCDGYVHINATTVANIDLAGQNEQATTSPLPADALRKAVESGKRTLLGCRAPMGSGKTESILNELLLLLPDATGACITPRVSLADNMHARCEALCGGSAHMTHYETLRKEKRNFKLTLGDGVVIQLESLWRIDCKGAQRPLIVVLDEIHALLGQFNGDPLFKNKRGSRSMAVFEWLLKNSDVVVVMDAHLQSWHLETLQNFMRPEKIEIFAQALPAVEQRFPVPSIRVVCGANSTIVRREVTRLLVRGKKVAVTTNHGPKFIESLRAAVCTAMPGIRIKVIHSLTPKMELKEFFKNPGKALEGIDLLIFSPTTTVGVDIQEPFDVVIGFYKQERPQEAVQQLRRVRNVVEEMVIFVGRPPAKQTAPAAEYASSCRACVPAFVPLGFDSDGSVQGTDTAFFELWANYWNDSRTGNFIERLLRYLEFGEAVRIFDTPEAAGFAMPSKEATDHTRRRQDAVAAEEDAAMAAAAVLSAESLDAMSPSTLTPEERRALERHKFVKHYELQGTFPLTGPHIKRYSLEENANSRGTPAKHTVADSLRKVSEADTTDTKQLRRVLRQRARANILINQSRTVMEDADGVAKEVRAGDAVVMRTMGSTVPREDLVERTARTHGFSNPDDAQIDLALSCCEALRIPDISMVDLEGSSAVRGVFRLSGKKLVKRTARFIRNNHASAKALYPGIKSVDKVLEKGRRTPAETARLAVQSLLHIIDLNVVGKKGAYSLQYGRTFRPTKKSDIVLPRPYNIGQYVRDNDQRPIASSSDDDDEDEEEEEEEQESDLSSQTVDGVSSGQSMPGGSGDQNPSPELSVRLPNLGNTCYLNAGLQMILHTAQQGPAVLPQDDQTPLWRLLDQLFDAAETRDDDETLLQQQEDVNTTHEKILLRNIMQLMDFPNDGQMRDFTETVEHLLPLLPAAVRDCFKTITSRKNVCLECGRQSQENRTKDFDVRVGVHGGRDLAHLLDDYCRATTVEYACDGQCANKQARQETRIRVPATELLIMLKRFDNAGHKNNAPVRIPLHLTFGERRYTLVGTAHHTGDTLNNGHWVWTARTRSGQWLRCSDDEPAVVLASFDDSTYFEHDWESVAAAHYRANL